MTMSLPLSSPPYCSNWNLPARFAISLLLLSTAVSPLSPPPSSLRCHPSCLMVYAPRRLLLSASAPCHLSMDRSAAWRTFRYHSPPVFVAVIRSTVSIPNTNVEFRRIPRRPETRRRRPLSIGIDASASVVGLISSYPRRTLSRTSPAWVIIAPRFAAARPP